MTSSLELLKQKLAIKSKPFPVWALLILYEKSNARDTYCDYFEGFKLLHRWLSPIELTPHSEPLHKLQRSYEIQELATILNTTQENLNHGYQTAISIIQLAANSPIVSPKVSLIPDECTGN